MAAKIGENTADDSYVLIFGEVVCDWWRHEIPQNTGITVFLKTVYYRWAFLNTAHP